MSPTIRIGELEIKSVSDGTLKTSTDFVLGMDKAQADQLTNADPDGSVRIPVNSFVFEQGDALVLVDAGAGRTMQPTLGRLPENLNALDYSADAITHVVMTHLHPDHANGLVDANGDALFPNAEILVHELEFDFWMGEGGSFENDVLKQQRARNKINMKPYLDRVRRMRDGDVSVECSPMLASGHSPGHTCWRIGTGRNAFVAWGDLVHFSAIQIQHPGSAVKYDLDPEAACRSRMRMLDMFATEGIAIAGAHVTAPGFGHISRKGLGYVFDPS